MKQLTVNEACLLDKKLDIDYPDLQKILDYLQSGTTQSDLVYPHFLLIILPPVSSPNNA